MMDKQRWVIDGFAFFNEQDAELARQEHMKIAYLESHMDMEDAPPEDVLTIYQRAIQDRLFRTPVGIAYLKHLYTYLLMQPEVETDRIPPIPLYLHYSMHDNESAGEGTNQWQRVKTKGEEPLEQQGDGQLDLQTASPVSEDGSEVTLQQDATILTKLKRAYLLPIMIAVNVLLVLMLVYMFVVAINSNQPNILNYQRVLENRYAGWEQELTEREEVIRVKERELNVK
jgi:hypothetical protein